MNKEQENFLHKASVSINNQELIPMVSKVNTKTGECEDVNLNANVNFKIHSQVVMVSKLAWKNKMTNTYFETPKQIQVPLFFIIGGATVENDEYQPSGDVIVLNEHYMN